MLITSQELQAAAAQSDHEAGHSSPRVWSRELRLAAQEIEMMRVEIKALRHGLQVIADNPGWLDHHARAAGVLRQTELMK